MLKALQQGERMPVGAAESGMIYAIGIPGYRSRRRVRRASCGMMEKSINKQQGRVWLTFAERRTEGTVDGTRGSNRWPEGDVQ